MDSELDELKDVAAPLANRRERKKRATRLALKAAALDLVAERGFVNVTVEDIADAVDVSVRTFFNHFDSKEAALVGDDPERIAAMQADLIALPPDVHPFEALRTTLVNKIRAIGEDIDLSGEDHQVWLRRLAVVRSQPQVLLAYTKHLAVIERALTDALVERLGGDERVRPYASLLTSCSMAVMRVVGMCRLGEGGTDEFVELAEGAFDLVARGLATDPKEAIEMLPERTGNPADRDETVETAAAR